MNRVVKWEQPLALASQCSSTQKHLIFTAETRTEISLILSSCMRRSYEAPPSGTDACHITPSLNKCLWGYNVKANVRRSYCNSCWCDCLIWFLLYSFTSVLVRPSEGGSAWTLFDDKTNTRVFSPYYPLLLSPCLTVSPLLGQTYCLSYLLLPLPWKTNKFCLLLTSPVCPSLLLSPSLSFPFLPAVICLILMSCFVLMLPFSSPLLSFLSSRSFCLSVIPPP